jgi:site-specific DNA-methyltransferase (adenine-specific)
MTDIRNGDCLELMKSIPDKSVDLMICDLPYGETNCKWDTQIDMVEFWSEFKRIRKSKKTACIHFCSTKFGYSLIKSWEKGFKMDMVWKKRNKTGGLQSRHRPMRNHEMIYFFYEQAPKYNRDKYHKRIEPLSEAKKMKEDTKIKKHKLSTKEFNTLGTTSKGECMGGDKFIMKLKQKGEKSLNGKKRYDPELPVSIIECEKLYRGKRHHQTEKPQDILEFFIKYWTDEEETILDPTMGSGSTGVACVNLNRKFIGFELDEKIFEKAKKRIEEKK